MICKYFDVYELVDKATFDRYGLRCWEFFTPQAIQALDGVREFFGVPVTINDWYWGGDYQWSGLRPATCDIGAAFSQHRFGNAFDGKLKGVTAFDARKAIMSNQLDPRLININALEGGVSWLHFDCRNIPERIKFFQP
jgi:hypothetical protein